MDIPDHITDASDLLMDYSFTEGLKDGLSKSFGVAMDRVTINTIEFTRRNLRITEVESEKRDSVLLRYRKLATRELTIDYSITSKQDLNAAANMPTAETMKSKVYHWCY